MQGTQVWSLIQEDSTCCGATKPVSGNYWDCALGHWATATVNPSCPSAFALQQEKPLPWEAHGLQLESNPHSLQLVKARVQQRRPSTAKNPKIFRLRIKKKIERRFHAHIHTHIQEKGSWRWSGESGMQALKTGVTWLQAKKHRPPPETGRSKNVFSSRASGGSMTLLTSQL